LKPYWEAFPTLRIALFQSDDTPYSSMAVDNIGEAIRENPDVMAFQRQFADAFDGYSNQTRSSGQSYQIEIAEDRSNNRIVQLWQQGSPWAISTFSRDRKVRLVPESEYKNGGNNK
jgi:hypothetical protein